VFDQRRCHAAPAKFFIDQQAPDREHAFARPRKGRQTAVQALVIQLRHAFGGAQLEPAHGLPCMQGDDASQFGVGRAQAFDERRAVQLWSMEQAIEPSVLVAAEVPILTMTGRAGALEQRDERVRVFGSGCAELELQWRC